MASPLQDRTYRINMASPLYIAACNGNEEEVRVLLEQDGIQINEGDHNGETPLLAAAERGYEKVVGLLLTRENINVNQGRS